MYDVISNVHATNCTQIYLQYIQNNVLFFIYIVLKLSEKNQTAIGTFSQHR